jgi:hypothetical protein
MLGYCDYLASIISRTLRANDTENLIDVVSRPIWDLGDNGEFLSTTKIVGVQDVAGKSYKITIEEV